MAIEFPEDLNPIPTPLTGSERVLADKGTATIDDVKAFARTGLPAPSAASDAATKGYVDARPGADTWSEHAATEDVDLDGHKITGLGEPTGATDAATKGYVDDRMSTLEWWEPVWTPASNVDSVSNIECQYTRTYRASGGSLVMLEGTITVEIDEDDAGTILTAPLPVPATSIVTLPAPAFGEDLSRGDEAVCRAGLYDMGSGPVLMIIAGALANATGVPATLTIGFRISYRAA